MLAGEARQAGRGVRRARGPAARSLRPQVSPAEAESTLVPRGQTLLFSGPGAHWPGLQTRMCVDCHVGWALGSEAALRTASPATRTSYAQEKTGHSTQNALIVRVPDACRAGLRVSSAELRHEVAGRPWPGSADDLQAGLLLLQGPQLVFRLLPPVDVVQAAGRERVGRAGQGSPPRPPRGGRAAP